MLERLAIEEPAKLATIAYGLLPRDIFVSVQPATPGNLDPSEWQVLVDLVRLIKANAPDGSTALPSDIAPALEETVRGHFAKVSRRNNALTEIEAERVGAAGG